jgi:hypothetical protein
MNDADTGQWENASFYNLRLGIYWMVGHISSEKNVHRGISITRALIPIHAIPAPLPVQENRTEKRFYYSERIVDGVVFVGRECDRVKALYCSSGRTRKPFWRIGKMVDIRV